MKTTSYSKKKILGLIVMPFVINALTAGSSPAADITPGSGETVTLSGTSNVDRVVATGDDVTVILNAGAELRVTDQYPAVMLLGDSMVSLNTNSKLINSSTNNAAVGIYFNAYDTTETSNSVTLDHGEVTVYSSGANSSSKGIHFLAGVDNGVDVSINLDNGSQVSVQSYSPNFAGIGSSLARGINVGSSYVEAQNISINLDTGSSVAAFAQDLGDGYANSISKGIYASADDDVLVNLSASDTTSEATATAYDYASGGSSVAISDGIDVATNNLDATVTLDDSTVTSTASAEHTDDNGTAEAESFGIFADAGGNATISLSNGSEVKATATATATEDGAAAYAFGLSLVATGEASVTLDNSSVIAAANANGSDATAVAAGIVIYDTPSAVITLRNGSSVSAMAETENDQDGMGVFVDSESTTAVINIDETSSIYGSNYAVYSAEESEEAMTSVNNSGLVSGRLRVGNLDNSATGVLQMNIPAGSDVRVTEVNDLADAEYYFTITDTASLADGTTFVLNSEDDFAALRELAPTPLDDLTQEERTLTYHVLTAGTPDWTQPDLNLTQTSGFASPMLQLAWVDADDSGENNLIATATFLTPDEAGLTRNGTAAFYAAYDDGLFNFYSSPEEWVPDVSGATLLGKTQFVDSSRFSISKRLKEVESGVNSGDGAAESGAWANVRYTDANQDERDDVEGFDIETSSLTVGYDRQLTGSLVTMGAALSYGTSDAETDVTDRDIDMSDYLLTLYGNYDADRWFVEGQLSYGWGDVDADRTISDTHLTASYDSDVYYARIAGGPKYACNGWQILPQSSLDYTRVAFDDYAEKGGGMALDVESDDYDIANIGLGLQMLKSYTLKNSFMLTPEAGAMVYYDLVGDDIQTTSTFINGTTPFVTKGAEQARTTYDLSLALTMGEAESPVSFKFGYEFIGREDFASHNVSAKLRYEF